MSLGESTARRRPRRSSLERSEALDSSKSPSSSSSRYAAAFGQGGISPDTVACLGHAYKTTMATTETAEATQSSFGLYESSSDI